MTYAMCGGRVPGCNSCGIYVEPNAGGGIEAEQAGTATFQTVDRPSRLICYNAQWEYYYLQAFVFKKYTMLDKVLSDWEARNLCCLWGKPLHQDPGNCANSREISFTGGSRSRVALQ